MVTVPPVEESSKIVSTPVYEATGTVSTMVGFGLPWVFDYFESDPALDSGPICAINQDVASLVINFVLISVLII